MKKFKNRGYMYVVERVEPNPTVVAIFATEERADDYKGQMEQDAEDYQLKGFKFRVSITTFYE